MSMIQHDIHRETTTEGPPGVYSNGLQKIAEKWTIMKPLVGPGGKIRTRTQSKNRKSSVMPLDQKVFSIQYSYPIEDRIAVSYGDGEIRVIALKDGDTQVLNPNIRKAGQDGGEDDNLRMLVTEKVRYPITAVRWQGANSKMLISTSPGDAGLIQFWDTASGREHAHFIEDGNRAQVLDFAKKGTSFASGGSDGIIRVYDSLKVCKKLGGDAEKVGRGHSSGVIALRFHNTDVNLILSGGMDRQIFLWDIAAGQILKRCHGPRLGPDGLDYGMHGLEVVSGSNDPREAIQLWDMSGKGNEMTVAKQISFLKERTEAAPMEGTSSPGPKAKIIEASIREPARITMPVEDLLEGSSPKNKEKEGKQDEGEKKDESSSSTTTAARGLSKGGDATTAGKKEKEGSSKVEETSKAGEGGSKTDATANKKGAGKAAAKKTEEEEELQGTPTCVTNQGVSCVRFSGRANYVLVTSGNVFRIYHRHTGDAVAEHRVGEDEEEPDKPGDDSSEGPLRQRKVTITAMELDEENNTVVLGDSRGLLHGLEVSEILHRDGNESKKRSKEQVGAPRRKSENTDSKTLLTL
ncbi:unnamed protein product [Amoebophrya sp. A25]|nr:unnamed protein product [Amoebophrya sp. A25]|eukprot:GSA25T00014632001.1